MASIEIHRAPKLVGMRAAKVEDAQLEALESLAGQRDETGDGPLPDLSVEAEELGDEGD